MGRGKFKGKPTGRRQFSTPEEMSNAPNSLSLYILISLIFSIVRSGLVGYWCESVSFYWVWYLSRVRIFWIWWSWCFFFWFGWNWYLHVWMFMVFFHCCFLRFWSNRHGLVNANFGQVVFSNKILLSIYMNVFWTWTFDIGLGKIISHCLLVNSINVNLR